MPAPRTRISTHLPADDSTDLDWNVVLAGTDNPTMASYLLARFGQRIPTPYLPLGGARSLLQQTLDRLNQLTPPSRTLTVLGPQRLEVGLAQVAGRSDHVLCQPEARDSGFGLYIALAMIRRWAPRAIVTITPAGHHVTPVRRYLEQVTAGRRLAAVLRDQVVLFGSRPSAPDDTVDYLELGEPVADLPEVGRLVSLVRRPTVAAAAQLQQRGALWSTSSACASVDALWALGKATEPRLLDILESLTPLVGGLEEDEAIDYIYRAFLPVSFGRDMVGRAPWRCVTLPLDGVTWSDVGNPAKLDALLGPDGWRGADAAIPSVLGR